MSVRGDARLHRLLTAAGACALAGLVLAALALAGPTSAQAGGTTSVTSAAYGNLRDDWDADEPALAPAALQSGSFGELFSTSLKGAIYAQPLVLNGTVIVTTEE
ncbi:MAG TPA: hypothetical protein VED41_01555, partial [Solirubrobacteraceae bacterium]|nr:hypothetical protein [Solirubrobacteraceae bacterium]